MLFFLFTFNVPTFDISQISLVPQNADGDGTYTRRSLFSLIEFSTIFKVSESANAEVEEIFKLKI